MASDVPETTTWSAGTPLVVTDDAVACDSPYVSWSKGEDEVCLDGTFTLPQLKEIVTLMEARTDA